VTQELFFNQAMCILVFWLGLKYFYPGRWWVWWTALLNGVFAGWGIWLWDQVHIPTTKALGSLIENGHYLSLINACLMFVAFLATIIIPTLAIISIVRRLLR